MPFVYEFKLNKEKIKGVEIGFMTNRKWEEALDDAKVVFPFMQSDTPFPMYGLLDIEVNEINNHTQRTVLNTKRYEYLVYSDRVNENTKYGNYKHEINGIEYTSKLDTLIMSSLAKSRSVYKTTQAPFIVNTAINDNDIADVNAYNLHARNEYIKVQETYYSDTTITFPQVPQTYVSTTIGPSYHRRTNAILMTNAPLISGSAVHNLSGGPANWVFPKGKWWIRYGYNGSADDVRGGVGFQWIYTFYVNVIDSFELSMYDIINEVRSCVSSFGGIEDTVYFGSTRVFDIDPADEEYLKSVQAPQMFLDTATARQMLIFAMSYINSIPRLRWASNRDILSVEKFGESQGTFVEKDLMDYGTQQNTQQIGTRSYAKIEQALPNNFNDATIYTPSQSGFMQVRATITELTANNFEIKLPQNKPIYVPKDLIVYVPQLRITAGIAAFTYEYDDFELSLMPRWINRDEWLLKRITLNYPSVVSLPIYQESLGERPNRVANLSWQIGDTSVKLSEVYGDLFQDNLLRNVVVEAMREWVMLHPPVPYFDGDIMETDYRIGYDIPTNEEYLDWRFRVEYITDETILTKQDKKDVSQINFYTEMRVNQDESIVNIVRQTKKNDSTLQRTGNVERSFSKIHKTLSDEYAIGTRDVNKYTITEITTQWYNDYFINTYYLTRYHNRIQQATFVDQTYRWRDNYAKQVFNRHEHYSDYLMVVPPDDNEFEETLTKIYTNFTVKRVVQILLGEVSGVKTKATVAVVRTDGMLELYPDSGDDKKMIVLPLSSYGIEGGFSFTFGFANNQVAGSQLVEQVGEDTKYYNQAVRYTDEWGRFTRFGFWLLSDLVIAEEDMVNYPLLTVSNYLDLYDQDIQYFGCGFMNSDTGSGESMIVNKDPLTNYVHTYELKMMSYYVGLYVFGLKFFTNNFIVSNPQDDTRVYLHLYTNGTYYDMLEDMKIKPFATTVIELDSTNCSFDIETLQYRFVGISLAGVTSWAIGNADGDLYVACNEQINGFNIVKTHIRPGVLGIGGVGYFNKIQEWEARLNTSMNFSYEKGRSVPISIPMALSSSASVAYFRSRDIGLSIGATLGMEAMLEYYKSKDIGVSISALMGMSSVLEYYRSKDIDYNLPSLLSMATTFEYYRNKNIGLNLNSSLNMGLSIIYAIGESTFYEINSQMVISNNFVYNRTRDIAMNWSALAIIENDFEYNRTRDIAMTISATMEIENDLEYYRSKDIGVDLSSLVGMEATLEYIRSKNIGIDLSSTMAMSADVAYLKSKNIGQAMNSTVAMALSVGYSRAYFKSTTPSLTDKSVTVVKGWQNSTSTYWNAQDPSNRDEITADFIPSVTPYAIGFALKFHPSFDPSSTFYYVAAKTGDSVRWKVTNNGAQTVTVYCKVGSGSYQSYGTLAGMTTSGFLTRTVTDAQTTVSCYVLVTNWLPSDVVTA